MLADDAIVRAEIDAIGADAQSGAVEIADRAAALLARLAEGWEEDEAAFRPRLAEVCRALTAAQPSMASLVNLCNAVLHEVDDESFAPAGGRAALATAPQRASGAALRFTVFLAHHARRIANEALPYIHSGALLLNHSHSGTVFSVLSRAHGAGKRFGVVCTEARPQLDGLQMARRLSAEGIPVEVIADAAAATFISGFYTVLIGADAIGPDGVVNKIGTLGLALAARQLGVPVYCFAGTEKFLPAGADFDIVEHDPTEIVQPGPCLRGFNLYYDQTPLNFITRVFTEDGPLSPAEVRTRLAALRLHPDLRREGER